MSQAPLPTSITVSYIAADPITGRVYTGGDADDLHHAPSSYNAYIPSLPSSSLVASAITIGADEAAANASGGHEPYRGADAEAFLAGISSVSSPAAIAEPWVPQVKQRTVSSATPAAAAATDATDLVDSYSDRTDYEAEYQAEQAAIAVRAAKAATIVTGAVVELCDGDEAIYSHYGDGDFEAEYLANVHYNAGQVILESKA